MEKMGIWNYSPAQMQPQIHVDLYDKIKARWDSTMQTVKDIFEQQLKQLVPSLTDAEVKKALLEHEDRMILKLKTCFILMKNIESVVKHASDVWKDVYHLRQPSEEAIEIKDDDSSDNDEDEFDNIPSITVTPGELHALMEEKEEEDKEEEALEEEKDEDDPIRIAVEAIASLPHTPPNTVTSMESTSTGEIVSTIVTSFTQSAPTPSQLQVSTMEVSTTSSTELKVTFSTTKPAHSI